MKKKLNFYKHESKFINVLFDKYAEFEREFIQNRKGIAKITKLQIIFNLKTKIW